MVAIDRGPESRTKNTRRRRSSLHSGLFDNMQTFIPFTFFFLIDNHLYPRAIPEPAEALHEPVPRPPTPTGPPTCCGGRLPASVVNKLNKLSVRSGLFKIVGEFGLRENLYYGSIFICMTLIVIVCFLVINNRGGAGLTGLISGSAAAYDGGTNLLKKYILNFLPIFPARLALLKK